MKHPWILFLGLVALTANAAPPPPHTLFVCVSQSKPFIIGSQVVLRNGLYQVEDRANPVHIGFNHPRIDAVAVDPRDPRRIYIAGNNGVMRSTDAGRTWKIVTSWDMTEGKDINVDPHAPDHVYVALPDGIAVSRDAGETWHRAQAGIKRAYTQSIIVDRTRAGRVLAGTELGIYLSEDGATTWTKVFASTKTVHDVRQSPHDPRVFLAATQAEGLQRSTDGGKTWQELTGVGRAHTLHNVGFDPADPRRLIVAGWNCGVLVSEDDGATWTPRNDGLPNAQVWRVGVDPDFPGRLYASVNQSPVYASDDFGRTWKVQWFTAATVWDFVFVPRS
ncbi:YCF48-related protein [Opitutus sp. ER46]|uniref:WD40/YVTN/BNR-like repeat-containing protein n=1 Tax=Opitutus sp. ER46 TaxID=2161864 RepID=UPI001304EE62|nr:YCF48-related protein [Opitutus sp. ER46]